MRKLKGLVNKINAAIGQDEVLESSITEIFSNIADRLNKNEDML